MATPAFQENAFQNLTAHGIKGFQVSDSGGGTPSGGGGAQMWHHHHAAHGIRQDEAPPRERP